MKIELRPGTQYSEVLFLRTHTAIVCYYFCGQSKKQGEIFIPKELLIFLRVHSRETTTSYGIQEIALTTHY